MIRSITPASCTKTAFVSRTVAAVNGVTYTGGLEWVCWTDLAIADQHTTFGPLADAGTSATQIVGFGT